MSRQGSFQPWFTIKKLAAPLLRRHPQVQLPVQADAPEAQLRSRERTPASALLLAGVGRDAPLVPPGAQLFSGIIG